MRRSRKEVVEAGAKYVYEAMLWAAQNSERGNPPAWQDHGNSFAQDKARQAADTVIDIYMIAMPLRRGDESEEA